MSLVWQLNPVVVINKHLMTGAKGKSEFCFPKTLNVACFTQGLFCYTFQLKNREFWEKLFAQHWLAQMCRDFKVNYLSWLHANWKFQLLFAEGVSEF